MLGKLAKQSAVYGVSTILGRLLSYLLTPYYTRLFAPSEYGIITDIYTLIPFALVILTMGMESSYFRFSARAEEESTDAEDATRRKQRLFSTTWGVTILLSLIFAAAIILFRGEVSSLLGESYSRQPYLVAIVAGITLFDVIVCVPFARFRERNEAHKYVILKLFNIIMQVGLAVTFGVAGLFATPMGVGWVLVANIIASILTFIATVIWSRPLVWPHIDRKLLGMVAVYSLPLLLSGIAATATDFIDRQLIKYLSPIGAMAQLGLYGAVTKIAVVMTLFTQMYRLAAEPFFLASFKKEEFVESNAAAMKYYIMATVAIFLGITLFKDLFIYIVGSDFREGVYILPVILVSNLLMGVWLNLSFWYKREEKTRFSLQITLVGLAVSLVANIYLIPRMGYIGAAWARLASEMVMVIYSYALSRRHFPIPYDLWGIAQYILLGGAFYGISCTLNSHFALTMAMNVGMAVVLLTLYLLFAVKRERIDVGAMLRRAIKR